MQLWPTKGFLASTSSLYTRLRVCVCECARAHLFVCLCVCVCVCVCVCLPAFCTLAGGGSLSS